LTEKNEKVRTNGFFQRQSENRAENDCRREEPRKETKGKGGASDRGKRTMPRCLIK